jgi:hypothetical protein
MTLVEESPTESQISNNPWRAFVGGSRQNVEVVIESSWVALQEACLQTKHPHQRGHVR